MRLAGGLLIVLMIAAGCNLGLDEGDSGGLNSGSIQYDEVGRVTRVIDGDTIDVDIDGSTYRVRYVGVNTPERDETCYADATAMNAELVEEQTVGLVRDSSDTDRYGRLLRYVYVGNTLVNAELVRDGYAEAVLYQPDDRYYDDFVELEKVAARGRFGCHATGIFDDNSYTR